MDHLLRVKSLRTRRQVPFYCEKSESQFRADPYERYREQVVRQSVLHWTLETWLYQSLWDWMLPYWRPGDQIAEIGCGVGAWIGKIADLQLKSHCWGIDYSYQMLRQAHDYWIAGKSIEIDGRDRFMSFNAASISSFGVIEIRRCGILIVFILN